MNPLREKLEKCKVLKGTVISLTDPSICEIIGNAGFDCVWIDTEHTYMSYKDVLCHLNGARSVNLPSLVRLPQNDLTATKKILEMGPDGVIFPMVKSYENFEELMKMTLYPPKGTRGFGPIRAIGYCPANSKDYVENKSLEICRFVQIETVSMIDDLEKIAQSPYVDGFVFGPCDLSGSVGEMLNTYGDATIKQVKRAIEILKKYNKKVGVACGSDDKALNFWCNMGLDMIFAGGDWIFVFDHAKKTLDTLYSFE